MRKQHRVGRHQDLPTNDRTRTVNHVPGEGRREQKENREKREFAGREFTHVD
jgi:hypothetical protein